MPGTDKADEIVMLGAHFDSWHSGTGATDNAAGSAVMMEAMRILKAIGLRPRRTIRIGLWSGEEQGLLGSRAYVNEHFADPRRRCELEARSTRSSPAYFNIDNGTGKIRGIYLQGNDAVRADLRGVAAAVRGPRDDARSRSATPAAPTTCRSTRSGCRASSSSRTRSSTSSRTHHTNMDVYDRAAARTT